MSQICDASVLWIVEAGEYAADHGCAAEPLCAQIMTEMEFRLLVMPECPKVFAAAARVIGAEDAMDVVQEMLRSLWEHRDSLGGSDSPVAYIRATGRNALVSHLRQTARHRSVPLSDRDDVAEEAAQPLAAEETRRRVELALAQLPDRQRRAVELTSFAELSVAEVAEATASTPEAVRQNLSRGRKRLRELLRRH